MSIRSNLPSPSSPVPLYYIGQTVFHVASESAGKVIAVTDYGDHYLYLVTWGEGSLMGHSAGEISDQMTFLGLGRDEGRAPVPTPGPRFPTIPPGFKITPMQPGR